MACLESASPRLGTAMEIRQTSLFDTLQSSLIPNALALRENDISGRLKFKLTWTSGSLELQMACLILVKIKNHCVV
ncbi:hypothetical protein RRG08_019696 [Elysia crispata]|uniref:Uncharacterized protein n=1 Tax=Elysia crispata TaxID=231223 RepID=A0AAE1CL14_9GAST|nr:hypothetical protein RRG08_019696 [Elysia crispata]